MTDKIKLILALDQIDCLTELLKDNEYKDYLYSKLIGMKVELQRQLSNYGKEIN
jgi:hypothetical protein